MTEVEILGVILSVTVSLVASKILNLIVSVT